jgi:hypothetical protein
VACSPLSAQRNQGNPLGAGATQIKVVVELPVLRVHFIPKPFGQTFTFPILYKMSLQIPRRDKARGASTATKAVILVG